MVLIDEQLIRKSAEHNEGEIFSLEELSLHQRDIERIDHIDRWCKDLKILYLQSNLIAKIEHLNRLKKLEYVNLALNLIERVENLEGCEFLKKLDLTVNFVGELTSIESLEGNYNLTELYLVGNPCSDYDGYRDYVICTLPQLQSLDGVEIKRSDRIKALQNYKSICKSIEQKQKEHFKLREKQRKDYEVTKAELDECEIIDPEKFWNEKSDYTPESRLETHYQQEKLKKQEEDGKKKEINPDYADLNVKRERKFFSDDGKPYSFNDPKVDYEYDGDGDKNIILTVHVFKHMDTSLCDVDVQPNYVRVTLKGKALQLGLIEEVQADSSSAKRSQITGHLVITMPKVNQIIRPESVEKNRASKIESKQKSETKNQHNYLEFDDNYMKNRIDLSNIVANNEKLYSEMKAKAMNPKKVVKLRDNSPGFVDDSDVPPLS